MYSNSLQDKLLIFYENRMPELQNEDKEMLDKNITINELHEAMKSMDTNKSPGTDGVD